MTWRGTLTLLLLVAAIFSGWSLWKQRQHTTAKPASSTRPDYVLNDFEVVALDKQGKEAFTLRAPHLERHPDDKTMSLITPLFLFPDKDGAYWQARSKTAWVSAKGDQVRMRGDVNIDSPVGGARPVKMRTPQLNVFPDANRASTSALVTVTQPGFIMHGRGFETDLKTKQYTFRSQVKSRYDPTSRR